MTFKAALAVVFSMIAFGYVAWRMGGPIPLVLFIVVLVCGFVNLVVMAKQGRHG